MVAPQFADRGAQLWELLGEDGNAPSSSAP
jgi:hypothetical protein